MYQQEYEEMYKLEDFYWWFVGRRAVVFAQIEDALGTHASPRAKLDVQTSDSQELASPRPLLAVNARG